MKRIPFVALAIVSSAALIAVLSEQPASYRVFAASPAQAQSEPLKTAQPQQAGQTQQPSKGIVLIDNGKPLTPMEQLQLQATGLQMEVQALQTQLKNDEASIHTLQSSLQTLQTQFANHSHKVTTFVPGHLCTGLNQYIVTQAGSGKQVQVGLETVQNCSDPKWNGSTPSSWESMNVSTPVQGAQTPQQ
jgi:hypothetical protein